MLKMTVTMFLVLCVATHALQLDNKYEPKDMRQAFAKGLAGGQAELEQHIKDRWNYNWLTHYEGQKAEGSSFMHEKDLVFPYTHARFDALGTVLQCPPALLRKFGHEDEEKHVCGLLEQEASGKTQDPCTIISVGSNNQWDFEVAVGQAHPNCQIHTLDCTVDGKPPASISDQTTFHKICLDASSHTTNGQQFMSWPDFMKNISYTGQPTVLKMDIEGYEWDLLQEIVRSGSNIPASVSLELHYQTQMEQLKWYGRYRSPLEIGGWMDYMFTRGGYMLVDRHDNPYCQHCSEVVLAQLAPRELPVPA